MLLERAADFGRRGPAARRVSPVPSDQRSLTRDLPDDEVWVAPIWKRLPPTKLFGQMRFNEE